MKQEPSALVPKNYYNRKRESKKTNESVFDRIYKYYYSSKTRIELDEDEERIRIRWEAAWFLLVRAQTTKAVADALERMFPISKSVAYDDIQNSMNLFGGDPRENVKPAKRAIAEAMALRCLSYAEQAGNLEYMDRFLQKYMDINGLKDKGNNNGGVEDLIKKLRPTSIVLTATKEELEGKAKDLHDALVKAMTAARKHEGEG